MEDKEVRRKTRFDAASKRLGEALKQYRINAGLTQQEVSDRAGPHKSVIGRIEQGAIKDPGFLTIAELAYIYGVGLNNLARRAEVDHAKEIITDGGWEAIDWRLVEGIRTLLTVRDAEWVDGLIRHFYDMVLTKAGDEQMLEYQEAELNRLSQEREALLDHMAEALGLNKPSAPATPEDKEAAGE